MHDRLSELARLPPGGVDASLAALLAVAGMVELVAVPGADPLAGAPVVALLAIAVLLRRHRPLGALAVGVAGMALAGLLSHRLAGAGAVPFLGVVFLVFSMAVRLDRTRVYAGAALALAGGLGYLALDDRASPATDVFLVVAMVVATPVAGGRLLRSRTRLTRALREKAERAERERHRHAAQAVEAERARIAGELHDVVAHSLGAMTVQAAAARRLAERDAGRAGSAFEAVEQTGREALGELRRLLGVLRHADEDLALAPQPRLAFLGDLARRATAAGLRVRLEVEGEPRGTLPTGVDLTAYRVVQEALNEALDSGRAGAATVHVRYRPGEVEVEVLDDGHGRERRLLGMRERVRVYGGQLEVAPRREGGHRVRARLPVEGGT